MLTIGDTAENLLKRWGTLLGLFQTIVIGLLGRSSGTSSRVTVR